MKKKQKKQKVKRERKHISNMDKFTLVEKDAACGIQTTRNWEYASEKPLEKLTMIIADVLDNRYEVRVFADKYKGTIFD